MLTLSDIAHCLNVPLWALRRCEDIGAFPVSCSIGFDAMRFWDESQLQEWREIIDNMTFERPQGLEHISGPVAREMDRLEQLIGASWSAPPEAA
ncbi:MAG: hypothetical protein FJ118_12445 [Deltaproteobacteria bacterium]|nr:hypothetical protein [Deltaproteobacteria bacterium]